MPRILVNIRGTNGSGKSTIPLSMMDDPKLGVIGINNSKRPYLTLFPTYGWVALGTYFNKTGGLDTYKNNEETRQALAWAWNYTDLDIVMEGIIASTIKSTYAELFKRYPTIIMSFLPPLEVCLDRVQQRNGGKPVKEDQIRSKWNTVDRNVDYFKAQGFVSLRINTAKVTKDQMLASFLKTVEKYRREVNKIGIEEGRV